MKFPSGFLYEVLILGGGVIFLQITLQMKWYKVKLWKSIPLMLAIIIVGLCSSQFWFFVENLYFGGRSLYGAVFLCPIFLYPMAKCLKVPYGEIMDFAAPAGCFVLGLAKVQCMKSGCCIGKVIYTDEDYVKVRFPSQFVEFVVFILIALILLILSRNKKLRRHIYPIAMIVYGFSRFILNHFRDVEQNYLFGLSQGAFWSLCSLFIGIGALVFMKRERIKEAWLRRHTKV